MSGGRFRPRRASVRSAAPEFSLLPGEFSLRIEGVARDAVRRGLRPVLRVAALANLLQMIGNRRQLLLVLGFDRGADRERGSFHLANPRLPIRMGYPFAVVLTGAGTRYQRGCSDQIDRVLIGQ